MKKNRTVTKRDIQVSGKTRNRSELFTSLLTKLEGSAENKTAYGLRCFTLSEFFEVDGTTAETKSYSLPEGFQDWDEWELIVCSKIIAMTQLLTKGSSDEILDVVEVSKSACSRSGTKHKAFRKMQLKQFELETMAVETITNFDSQQWRNIFSLLENRGKVSFQDVVNLFKRIDAKHQNYKLGNAHLVPPRQKFMVLDWINLNGDIPALCTFDNTSAALVLSVREGDINKPMLGTNFSRDKAKWNLISCKKPLYRARNRRGALIIERAN